MSNYARYVRWTTGSSSSGTMSLSQIQVWAGGVNVASGAYATMSTSTTLAVYPSGVFQSGGYNTTGIPAGTATQALTTVTNGATVNDGTFVEFSTNYAQVVVDLGSLQFISSVVIWPWFGGNWVFSGVEIDFSPTNANGSWTTVFTTASIATSGALTNTAGYVIGPFCFLKGTGIATPDGERAIERLQEGDTVRTSDGRDVAVVETRHTAWDVGAAPSLVPVRIPRGVLGATRDLLLSERHGVWSGGALVPAALVQGAERATEVHGVVDYYHLRLPQPHDFLVANGVACESLR
jgi:hypothetical protein